MYCLGTFLAVQWLGFSVSMAEGMGSIPGQQTKAPTCPTTWTNKQTIRFFLIRMHTSRLCTDSLKKTRFPCCLSLFLSALFQRTPISHCDRKEWPSWFHGLLPESKVLEKGIFTDRKKMWFRGLSTLPEVKICVWIHVSGSGPCALEPFL